jgi:hypothetical protein
MTQGFRPPREYNCMNVNALPMVTHRQGRTRRNEIFPCMHNVARRCSAAASGTGSTTRHGGAVAA